MEAGEQSRLETASTAHVPVVPSPIRINLSAFSLRSLLRGLSDHNNDYTLEVLSFSLEKVNLIGMKSNFMTLVIDFYSES